MWQKLKRIDVFELKKAVTQLINAAQLVNAATTTYANSQVENLSNQLLWENETSALMSSVFGKEEKVKVMLDTEQFVLSIYGQNDHIEHLILSGITYPMAFGWMRIKLDSFDVNGEYYNDRAPYTIANPLGLDDEMYVTNQQAFSDLTTYFGNAFYILKAVQNELKIYGEIHVDPSNLRMRLTDTHHDLIFGFSPGDTDFPDPYFFIQTNKQLELLDDPAVELIGITQNKGWRGVVLIADEYIKTDAEREETIVRNFFTHNAAIIHRSPID